MSHNRYSTRLILIPVAIICTVIYFAVPSAPNPAELLHNNLRTSQRTAVISEVQAPKLNDFDYVPYMAEDWKFDQVTAVDAISIRILYWTPENLGSIQFVEPEPLKDCKSTIWRYKGVVVMQAEKTVVLDGRRRTYILLLAKVKTK